jgi:glycosyltransferase involved in cell wall biosynthesis
MIEKDARPKILHLHSAFDAGGKEVRCVRLINAFGQSAEHAIVSADPLALGAADLIAPDILALYPTFPSLRGKPTPGRLRKLAAAMKRYDLVLTYNWGAMDAVMAHTLFAQHMNLPPLVHHEDGFNEDEAGGLKWTRNWYRRLALARAAALVVPSRTLEEIALNVWLQPRTKVRRIANGIDIARYASEPPPDSLPGIVKRPGDFWIGTLAGLRKVKNLPRLVRVAAQMPREWHLVIVGDGPEGPAIRAEAERLGIASRVHMPGFVADPSRVVGLFDIFALSSESEQFPISVVEAMAAGLPVAAPDVGDVTSMVCEENREYIVPAGDEQELARVCVQMTGDDALRLRLGARNQLRAQEEYDEYRMVDRYRALYGSLIGGGALRDPIP